MKNDNRREQLIDIIKREFIGPDPINIEGHIQSNGEEILSSDPPRIKYSAGILFPDCTTTQENERIIEEEVMSIDESELFGGPETIDEIDEKLSGKYELLQDTEEMLNLSNSYHQSAISLTASISMDHNIYAKVKAGMYFRLTSRDPNTDREIVRYPRTALYWDNKLQSISLPNINEKVKEYSIDSNGKNTNLKFVITYRYNVIDTGDSIYTFTLRNTTKLLPDQSIKDENCYFQAEFNLYSDEGFSPLPDKQKININDEDYQSNQLLYRNIKSYAIGHGCSADWRDSDGRITEIFTDIFPTYEIKPIVPNSIPGVSLQMFKMSDLGNFDQSLNELNQLCSEYKNWINNLKQKSLNLKQNYKDTSEKHIANCEKCYQRMCDGVKLIENNENVRKAFQYMNRAMLLQQLHYNLPLQTWIDDGNGEIILSNAVEVLPNIMDSNTWYGESIVYGKWRPFQLAFVLINLESMSDKYGMERDVVDLIWFPTGERVIIVTGCINALVSRISGTLIENDSCIA